MEQHVSTPTPTRSTRARRETHSLRILIQNPPRMNLHFFLHGMREVLAPVYGNFDIDVEPKGPQKTETFEDMMTKYVISVLKMRTALKTGLCVVLQPAMAKVERDDGNTLMPVYMCSILLPGRLLGHGLDTFMPQIDEAEADQLLQLGIMASRMQLPVSGDAQELALAESLIERINTGLIAGYEMIDTPVFSPYRKGN